jgi:hypothetical protein
MVRAKPTRILLPLIKINQVPHRDVLCVTIVLEENSVLLQMRYCHMKV